MLIPPETAHQAGILKALIANTRKKIWLIFFISFLLFMVILINFRMHPVV